MPTTPTRNALAGKGYAGLCGFQGLFYLVTGVWPILSISTFEAVTGEKEDDWLVQTVGALIAVIGTVLLVAAWRGKPVPEVALLAVGSAVALAAVDVVFVSREVIPPVYLLDAVVEALLILAWAAVAWRTWGMRGRD